MILRFGIVCSFALLLIALSFAFPPYGTPIYPSQFISFNTTASPHLCTVDSKYFYRVNLAEKGSLSSGTSEVCIWDLEKKETFATIPFAHRLKAICAWDGGFYAVTETNKVKDCLYYCDLRHFVQKKETLQYFDHKNKTAHEIELLSRRYAKSSSLRYKNIKIECYSGFKEPLEVLTFGEMLVIPCKTPQDWKPSSRTQDRIKLNTLSKGSFCPRGKQVLTLFVDSEDSVDVNDQHIFMLLKNSSKLVQINPFSQAIEEYSVPKDPIGICVKKRELSVYYQEKIVVFSTNEKGKLDYSNPKTIYLRMDWDLFWMRKQGYYFTFYSCGRKTFLLRRFNLLGKMKSDLILNNVTFEGNKLHRMCRVGDFLCIGVGQHLWMFGLQEGKDQLFSALTTVGSIGRITQYNNEVYVNTSDGLLVLPCYPDFNVVHDLIRRKRYLSYFSKVELSEYQSQELDCALQDSSKDSCKSDLGLLKRTKNDFKNCVDLPDELHMQIMSYLTPCDLARYGMSCKGLRQLSQDKILQPVHEYYLSLARMAIGWNIVLNDDLETTKTEDQKAEHQKLLEKRDNLREGFFSLLLHGVRNKDKVATEVAQFLVKSSKERRVKYKLRIYVAQFS